jgi:hypothetical protein
MGSWKFKAHVLLCANYHLSTLSEFGNIEACFDQSNGKKHLWVD